MDSDPITKILVALIRATEYMFVFAHLGLAEKLASAEPYRTLYCFKHIANPTWPHHLPLNSCTMVHNR
jgi:hypothetical protein